MGNKQEKFRNIARDSFERGEYLNVYNLSITEVYWDKLADRYADFPPPQIPQILLHIKQHQDKNNPKENMLSLHLGIVSQM